MLFSGQRRIASDELVFLNRPRQRICMEQSSERTTLFNSFPGKRLQLEQLVR